MRPTFAALKFTNLFTNRRVQVNALVDTVVAFICVTEKIANYRN